MERITDASQLKPGDIYEDSYSHPCLCVEIKGYEVNGISLVDGSYPRNEDLRHARLRRLNVAEAWHWRANGPRDKEVDLAGRWWQRDKPAYLHNPAGALENLFFFALYQVQWHPQVQADLGEPIRHEWHNVHADVRERQFEGQAAIQFDVKGMKESGTVRVRAFKVENNWSIEDLTITIGGKAIELIKNGQSL